MINGVIHEATIKQSSSYDDHYEISNIVDILLHMYSSSMWAIGVIIFVSLAGYFPFHEDIDILSQLDNIPRLFQDEIFTSVTDEVKDLLRLRLLVPDAGHRMHSAGVIYHDWFQKSPSLLLSCKNLEQCLEKKWLTLFFEESETTSDVPVATVEESDSN
jgi:serine/threonine protein kinase